MYRAPLDTSFVAAWIGITSLLFLKEISLLKMSLLVSKKAIRYGIVCKVEVRNTVYLNHFTKQTSNGNFKLNILESQNYAAKLSGGVDLNESWYYKVSDKQAFQKWGPSHMHDYLYFENSIDLYISTRWLK